MRRLVYLLLLFVLSTTIGLDWVGHQYLVFVLSLFFLLSWGFIKYTSGAAEFIYPPAGYKKSAIDLIPLAIFFVWIYGVLLGLILKNNIEAITRNFAGMAFYLIFYLILYSGLGKKDLLKISHIATWINIGIALFFLYATLDNWGKLGGGEAGLTGFRAYISPGLSIICVYLSIKIYNSFAGRSKQTGYLGYITGIIWFLVASYVLVGVSVSKGYILGFLMMLSLIPGLILIREAVRRKISFSVLLYFSFAIILTGYVFFTDFGTLVLEMFDSAQEGNAMRTEQAEYLINEFSFFGSGLGAALSSGYSRDDLGYGFELTYHNVIHKFGIFSLIIFSSYAATFFMAAKGIVKNKDPLPSVAALGAMIFLIPGYGNPILFAPVSVTLHCMALFWLRQASNNEGNNHSGHQDINSLVLNCRAIN